MKSSDSALQLKVHCQVSGSLERTIDLTGVALVRLKFYCTADDNNAGLLCVSIPQRYDLLLQVENKLSEWLSELKKHFASLNIEVNEHHLQKTQLMKELVTKEDRQQRVEYYMRALFKEIDTPGHKMSKNFAAVSYKTCGGRKRSQVCLFTRTKNNNCTICF